MNLSKSRYTRGTQCPKMLWMEAHRPELYDASVMNQAVLAAGNEVGDLAMGYYGAFVEVPFLEHGFPAMARLTERLIAAALVARADGGEPVDWDAWPLDEAAARQAAAELAAQAAGAAGGERAATAAGAASGEHAPVADPLAAAAALAGRPVICEATFALGGDLCMADILLVEADGVRMVEVKSSTHVRDVYLHDMAFQRWVIEGCGYRVKSTALMHVDGSYVREGALDVRGLFAVEDRTEEVRALAAGVAGRAALLKAVADAPDEPALVAPDRGVLQPLRSWADFWDGGEGAPAAPAASAPPDAPAPLGGDASPEAPALPAGRRAEVLASVRAPRDIGPHCTSPYPCGFRAWCWRAVPRPGVFDLAGWQAARRFRLYDAGVATLDDVAADAGLRLSALPARQLEAWTTGAEVIADAPALRRFLDGLWYPLAFLDFETFQQAVPPFDGTRPYEQIPSQFSLHIYEGPKSPLVHREFLVEAGADPRRAVAEALVAAVPAGACVLAYNMSFEKAVIRDLAAAFPDLADVLGDIRGNVRDLMTPFRSGACYAAAQGGSTSIKAVLPALFPDDPELDYHALPGVANGSEAMAAFADLAGLPPEEAAAVRAGLLAYCRLDTLAMVRVWERLRELAGE